MSIREVGKVMLSRNRKELVIHVLSKMDLKVAMGLKSSCSHLRQQSMGQMRPGL